MEKIQQILEDLTDEEMKHFRYLLGDHRIPAGKLENANAWKVAELLKKFYHDKKKALNVVVDILGTIPRMDLVERLIGKEDLDELDGFRKQSVGYLCHQERALSGASPDHDQDSELKQPINKRNVKANVRKNKVKDYGRDGKLRYPSISQMYLGFTISVLGAASAILTPHSRFAQARIPWWSGVLFCVIGMIPLLPLRISEKFKLRIVLVSNIIGLLITLASIGLSIWNGIEQTSDIKVASDKGLTDVGCGNNLGDYFPQPTRPISSSGGTSYIFHRSWRLACPVIIG
ncbi:uncharacterized protein LOC122544060 isoform X2 [Chiloscyllium plagiosum]|nr:uncharacterized protein LOC122544060 isoform X2 [Chiloscyllium plagiosum]XP_043538989.1 uncharacterized protein LOC122544060 isoform X2 [Chiloscyllium plagiosum]